MSVPSDERPADSLGSPDQTLPADGSVGDYHHLLNAETLPNGEAAVRADRSDDTETQSAIRGISPQPEGEPSTLPFVEHATNCEHESATSRACYRDLRFHAQGGQGEVFRAFNPEFSREVALKFLKAEFLVGHEEIFRRFLDEAAITGRLEHPGIVPIYGVGQDNHGQPCYAMRFVQGVPMSEAINVLHQQGEDAAAMLAQIKGSVALGSPHEVRKRLLRELITRLQSVCETIAYAHSRNILHRDLKPSNVMLGRFGETLVVDWGLARTLTDGKHRLERDEVGTATSWGSSEHLEVVTKSVGLKGTPAYMSPEQADGLGTLSAASDVYSLGATLYAILTARAPYQGPSYDIVMMLRRRRPPAPLRAIQPDVPRALEAVCRKAMALDPNDRYPSAGALANDLDNWLADRPVTAWREPILVRLRRRVERHRTAVIAAGTSLLLAGLVASVGWSFYVHQETERRKARAHAIESALDDAILLGGQAKAGADLARWAEAVSAAKRAHALLTSADVAEPLWVHVGAVLTALERGQNDALAHASARARDERMIEALDEARLMAADSAKADETEREPIIAAYRTAFREYGIDLDRLDTAEAAARIRASAIQVPLAAAADHWASLTGGTAQERLLAITRLADPDPLRDRLRDALARRDPAVLRALAELPSADAQPAATLNMLGELCARVGEYGPATRLLERAWQSHPDDFWINNSLGSTLLMTRPPRLDEAMRFLSTAVSLRPTSPGARLDLAAALEKSGRRDEAIAEFHRALQLNPRNVWAHNELGNALLRMGRTNDAIGEYHAAIALGPENARLHNNLGQALQAGGHLDDAIDEYRRALRLNPRLAEAHNNLGNALQLQGRLHEAVEEYRGSLARKPEYAEAHTNLGSALQAEGKLDEAIAEHRLAVAERPDLAQAHNNLGNALVLKGLLDESIAEYRRAVALLPDDAHAHGNLAAALRKKGRADDALVEYRRSAALAPADADAHFQLGNALLDRGALDEAAVELRRALVLRPDHAAAHANLGALLFRQRQYTAALDELTRGHALGARFRDWTYPTAQWIEACRRMVALETRLDAALRGDDRPRDVTEQIAFGTLCMGKERFAAAVPFFESALADPSRLALNLASETRLNAAVAAVAAGLGRGKNAPESEAARASLRARARDWLDADLRAWREALQGDKKAHVTAARHALDAWHDEPGLAPVRGDAGLRKLPADERNTWRSLWDELEQLRESADEGRAETKPDAPQPNL
jgi:serine/threonine-protein kinase